MPALSFRVGRSTLGLDAEGTVVALVPDALPGQSYLLAAGSVSAWIDDELLSWSGPELSIDTDEVEVTRRHRDRLQVVVRHTFGDRWSVRVALSNLGPASCTLAEVSLGWTPAPQTPAWALAAGAAGSYAVFAPDGRGPVLGGVLELGAVESVSPTALGLGPVRLEPAGRYVVQWQWRWYASPRAFAHRSIGQRSDRQVPRSLHLPADEVATISAGDDEALVLAPGVAAEPVRDQLELTAGPGRYPIEVRWARGVTHYDLGWADPVAVLLAQLAESLLAGPRTPAGVVALTDVNAASAVQFALRLGLDDPETAGEALDLFTARLPEPVQLAPRTASYLCGEFDRTGDLEWLEAATEVVLRVTRVLPGLGLAASQVGLARLLADRPLDALTRRVRALATAAPPPGSGSVADQVAGLELAVFTQGADPTSDLLARIGALGGWLGAGLKGSAVRPLPVEAAAHLAAVLAATSDAVSEQLRTRWPCTVHELGRWTEAATIARLAGQPVTAAHTWLAAAARTP